MQPPSTNPPKSNPINPLSPNTTTTREPDGLRELELAALKSYLLFFNASNVIHRGSPTLVRTSPRIHVCPYACTKRLYFTRSP